MPLQKRSHAEGSVEHVASKGHRVPGYNYLVRDFKDPYLELLRLIKEVAEIEHALMAQYLFAAFSIKPAYRDIAGSGAPDSTSLLGVAVQEMQHLSEVNHLLVALGACPSLGSQDMPYEPDIYPCRFELEPLSRLSLAKYVYAEAPADSMNLEKTTDPKNKKFIQDVQKTLSSEILKANHVGSVYQVLIDQIKAISTSKESPLKNPDTWIAKMEDIMLEGEVDHFRFFKSLFTGKHAAFKDHNDIWSLQPNDPAFPSYPLPKNPSAYLGHEQQIQDVNARNLAWLSNLHYWIVLALLDHHYRTGDPMVKGMAMAHMLGPFRSIAQKLTVMGYGIPFDHLSMGYAPCAGAAGNLQFIKCLMSDASGYVTAMQTMLPTDYPDGLEQRHLKMLEGAISAA